MWQNIEMMSLKIEYKKNLKRERQLIIKNDRLRCEIEKYKRMDIIIKYAEENLMKPITPMDFKTIVVKKNINIDSPQK